MRAHWGTRLYPVYLTLAEPAAKKQNYRKAG